MEGILSEEDLLMPIHDCPCPYPVEGELQLRGTAGPSLRPTAPWCLLCPAMRPTSTGPNSKSPHQLSNMETERTTPLPSQAARPHWTNLVRAAVPKNDKGSSGSPQTGHSLVSSRAWQTRSTLTDNLIPLLKVFPHDISAK